MENRIDLLLDMLDRAFDKSAWHGTTLRGALRGLDAKTALWRPAPDRHNIWEYLLHAAYWKYIVRRHLTGDKTARFEKSPSNWPGVPENATARDLRDDIAFLRKEHRLLRDSLAQFPDRRLDEPCGKNLTFRAIVGGVVAHDLYHTGQIQLLKRLGAK